MSSENFWGPEGHHKVRLTSPQDAPETITFKPKELRILAEIQKQRNEDSG
jgi:hypothetical protein